MRMLDLFSGIGGFHKGFEQAGFDFDWVGFSEIDKYASAVYKHQFKKSEELGDITTIQPERDLPNHIDILCGGFPCQAFSLAGLKKGFNDTRGTLFFEIARILRYYRENKKPIPCFLLENVKGLLMHDNGRTFATIYRVLTDIGYTIECELLNTRNFSIPQNRERIFIAGYFGNGGGPKIFPIGNSSTEVRKIQKKGSSEYTRTITTAHSHGTAKHMSFVKSKINITGKTKSGNSKSYIYSSNGIVGSLRATDYKQPKQIKVEPVLTQQDRHGVMINKVGNIYKSNGENGNVYNANGISPSLKSGGDNGIGSSNAPKIINQTSIRRLTPRECLRLQGFEDDWNEVGDFDGVVTPISDTQRYKQAGNSVTVDVIQAIAKKIKKVIF